jgi:hypothetical protein
MMSDCYNPNSKSFQNYGGRGILVCERWQEFPNFFSDMGERPSAKHSLGRIDNDQGYSPENCRWETMTEQSRNRRSTRLTLAMAREIRMQYRRGYSSKELGIEFNVSRQSIADIVFGRTWKEENV